MIADKTYNDGKNDWQEKMTKDRTSKSSRERQGWKKDLGRKEMKEKGKGNNYSRAEKEENWN